MARFTRNAQLAAIAAVFGLLLASHAFGQTVDGRVVGDSSRRALGHVRVLLVDSVSQRAVDSTETDPSGIFYLTAPGPGTYALAFERPSVPPSFSRSWRLARDDTQQGLFELPETNSVRPLSASAVDQRAVPIPGNPAPRYPDRLRKDGVQGNALLKLVIDPAGRVVASSVEIVEATVPEFGLAAKATSLAWRFQPARKLGRQVYQVACVPTTFRLTPGNDRDATQLDSLAARWGKDGDCPQAAATRQPNER